MSCSFYSHTGKRSRNTFNTLVARAACHQEDDESSQKSEVAAQLHKSGHQNKDESTKVTIKGTGAINRAPKSRKRPETLTSALRLPPRHICLQAVILDVHVAVVSTKPHWHEVSARKESSQLFLLANLARKGKKALRCVTSTFRGVESKFSRHL